MTLLGLLPLLVLMGFIFVIGNIDSHIDWRHASLRGAVLWGSFIVIANELLSIGGLLSLVNIIIVWSLALLGVIVFIALRMRRGNPIRFPHPSRPATLFEGFLIVSIVLILTLTAILAWKSPPQTWDTLNYHMPKVAHWAQNQKISHYTTGIETQNYMSPGLEFIVLHFYILAGGDQLVTLVNWFFVLGSLIGVSFLASQFGLDRKTQIVSVLFTATLPMGIVQASGMMTDGAVAFWMVAVAAEAIALRIKQDDRCTIPSLGLSAGLTILTKPTGYAFAFPFAVFVAITLLRRKKLLLFVRSTLLALLLVLVLNLGHLIRNLDRYGNPLSPHGRFSAFISEEINLPIIISNTLRNASLHAGTPSPYVNKAIYLVVKKVHDLIGIDVMDPRTTHSKRYKVFPPSTHEDLTSNPLHALLILIAFILLLLRRKEIPKEVLISGLLVSSSFVLVSSLVQWQLYNARLHQAFFVLAAPWTVFMLSKVLSSRWVKVISVLLLIAAWPWLVHIRSRPLIYQRGESYVDSVLKTSRFELYYASGGHLKIPHSEITSRIKESGCSQVGLILPGNDAEYPIWVLLDAPRHAPRIEWLIDDPFTDESVDSDFQVCAIILHPCAEDQGVFAGLPRVYEHKATDFCLYLEE